MVREGLYGYAARPTILPSSSHPGYFGGGSVFQAMAGPPPFFQANVTGNAFRAMHTGNVNPMYGNMGIPPGLQGVFGSTGAPAGHYAMADFSQPYTGNAEDTGGVSARMVEPVAPFLHAPVYDSLTPMSKPKDYKEGGAQVKFESFSGTQDKLKALTFIQQFDAAYTGGNFTESSKVRKAATFLKGNALQWWTTMLLQGHKPATWVQFKQVFASAWLTNTFEVEVMTRWHKLDAANCENLEEYNKKYWEALLPVSSYREVSLSERIEKYCCGLPTEIRDYCTKTNVSNITQLIENATMANALMQGKSTGFKGSKREMQGKQFAGKSNLADKSFTSKPFVGKSKFAGKQFPRQPFKPNFEQRKGQKRQLTGKSAEERKALMEAGKCFVCEQEGHFAKECPQKTAMEVDDKSESKGKKPKPSAGLVPDMVSDQPNTDATELCRAWGKVRDQTVLVFFDPGARANFISPELASKLGIRAEEMGLTGEAGLACPGHTEPVTPILGKLRLHIQSYVDAEEFHIMPLEGCDVLLGIPWCYRLHAMVDTYNKKITLVHREQKDHTCT